MTHWRAADNSASQASVAYQGTSVWGGDLRSPVVNKNKKRFCVFPNCFGLVIIMHCVIIIFIVAYLTVTVNKYVIQLFG